MNNKVDIKQLVKNTNIVDVVSSYLTLKQKGKNYWGVCPFHPDSDPSMSVSNEKGLFKCFSCQAGGNVIVFLTRFNKWTFYDSVKHLAQLQGVEINLQQDHFETVKYSDYETLIIEALKDAMNIFSFTLFDSNDQILKNYLSYRKLDTNLIKHFGIGFADSDYLKTLARKGHTEDVLISASLATDNNYPFFRNRLVFAIRNSQGDIVGFSGRTLEHHAKSAKYINSSEFSLFNKSQLLYNYSLAKNAIEYSKEIVIVEGFMDVIAYYRDGIENVVAIMGTALTEQHLKLIKNNKVILSLDGDKAGINATIKSLQLLLKHNIETSVLVNKQSIDPDEMLQQQGEGALVKFLTEARISGIEFLYQIYKKDLNPTDFDSVQKFSKSMSEILSYLSQEKTAFYINKIENELKINLTPQHKPLLKHNQNTFVEHHPFDPNERRAKFENNFHKTKSDPFLTEEDKYQFNKTYRSDLFIKIILLLIKNPNFFEHFHPREVPWDNLDQKLIVENMAANFLKKSPNSLNQRQNQIYLDFETKANNLSKFEYSSEFSDFEDLVKRIKKMTYNISLNNDLKQIGTNPNKEIVKNINETIRKRRKIIEKD